MLDPLQFYCRVLCNGMKMRFRMVMIAHPGPGIGFHKWFMWWIIILPTPELPECTRVQSGGQSVAKPPELLLWLPHEEVPFPARSKTGGPTHRASQAKVCLLELSELYYLSPSISWCMASLVRSITMWHCRQDNNPPHESFVESDSRARMSYHNHPKSRLHSIT